MRQPHTALTSLLGTLFLLAALTPVSQAVAQTCVQPPEGLVSWWPGDGDATDIAGVNDGTLQNGVTFAPGMVGQAFSFDGVDDHVIAAPYTGGPIYAFDFWFKPAVTITPTSSDSYPVQFHDGGVGIYEALLLGQGAGDSSTEVIALLHDGVPGYGRTFVEGITLQGYRIKNAGKRGG